MEVWQCRFRLVCRNADKIPGFPSFHQTAIDGFSNESAFIDSVSSLISPALNKTFNCSVFVALAIGAAMAGLDISQANTIVAGEDWYFADTSSRADRIIVPFASIYFCMPLPRTLLLKSFSFRYLPVKNPLASEK
jgi:hypothetical protein